MAPGLGRRGARLDAHATPEHPQRDLESGRALEQLARVAVDARVARGQQELHVPRTAVHLYEVRDLVVQRAWVREQPPLQELADAALDERTGERRRDRQRALPD